MFKIQLHEDTGWIGIGKYSFYRKINNIVYVNFQETPQSLGDFVTIFTMPVGFRPSRSLLFTVAENNATIQYNANILLKNTGELTLITNKHTQFIGSFSYPID